MLVHTVFFWLRKGASETDMDGQNVKSEWSAKRK